MEVMFGVHHLSQYCTTLRCSNLFLRSNFLKSGTKHDRSAILMHNSCTLELGVLSYDVDSLTVVLLSNALVSDSARSCKKQAQIASPKVPQL
jgi:hypothetical protein